MSTDFEDRKIGNAYTLISSIAPSETGLDWFARWRGKDDYYFCFRWAKDTEPPITLNELKQLTTNGQVSICYPLATPVTYNLAPTIIKSLKGANTIWSDTNGNVSLKYWKH